MWELLQVNSDKINCRFDYILCTLPGQTFQDPIELLQFVKQRRGYVCTICNIFYHQNKSNVISQILLFTTVNFVEAVYHQKLHYRSINIKSTDQYRLKIILITYFFQVPSELMQLVRKDPADNRFHCTFCDKYSHRASYHTIPLHKKPCGVSSLSQHIHLSMWPVWSNICYQEQLFNAQIKKTQA